MANRPETPVRVDGDPSDWPRIPATPAQPIRGARDGGPSVPDWTTTSLRLAIDTYDPERGVTHLPSPGPATIATGAEFLVDLRGPGASFVTVAEPYEPYAAIDGGPIVSPPADHDGGTGFVPLTFEANRERIGRDGTRSPAIKVNRGVLRYGSLDPAAPEFDTRTDVAVGAAHGTIELRLPWGLLNVSDPSSRRVLHQDSEHEPPLDTVATEGFRIYAFAADPSHPKRAPLSRLPAAGAMAPLYAWAPWDAPKSHMEPKAGVAQIRAALRALPDRVAPPAGGRGR